MLGTLVPRHRRAGEPTEEASCSVSHSTDLLSLVFLEGLVAGSAEDVDEVHHLVGGDGLLLKVEVRGVEPLS